MALARKRCSPDLQLVLPKWQEQVHTALERATGQDKSCHAARMQHISSYMLLYSTSCGWRSNRQRKTHPSGTTWCKSLRHHSACNQRATLPLF